MTTLFFVTKFFLTNCWQLFRSGTFFIHKFNCLNIHRIKTKLKLFISRIFYVQRQGRLAPSGPVQTHRSNVAYTSSSGVRSPQGPTRSGPRPPAPPTPDEGPLPPAPPLDVTGESLLSFQLFRSTDHIIQVPSFKKIVPAPNHPSTKMFCVNLIDEMLFLKISPWLTLFPMAA